jgi:hypothetical protein
MWALGNFLSVLAQPGWISPHGFNANIGMNRLTLIA